MTSSRLSTKLAGSAWESRMPFNLLVAYEDHPTRDRALHLSHHLSTQLAEEYDFQCSWWKFDHLANEILHQQAAKAAAEANMIVLAINARQTLAPLQAQWLESWLPHHRTAKGALVALMAIPDSGRVLAVEQAAHQLKRLAASAELDFFCHSFDLPGASSSVEEGLGRDATGVDERINFKMPIPRWGINE